MLTNATSYKSEERVSCRRAVKEKIKAAVKVRIVQKELYAGEMRKQRVPNKGRWSIQICPLMSTVLNAAARGPSKRAPAFAVWKAIYSDLSSNRDWP